MTDEQVPQQQPGTDGRHDTSVLSWPTPAVGAPGEQGFAYGEQPYAQGHPLSPPHQQADWPQVDPAVGGAGGWDPQRNPEAAYWEARFRRQRTWTRLLGAAIAAGLLLFVGGGLLVWTVLIPRASSAVSQALGAPEQGGPEAGAGSGPTVPDDSLGGDAAGPDQPDLSDVPLPDALRGPGSVLGIENMEQLLDTAVSMGLMTQEQADAVRAAVAAGGSFDGLLGGALGGQS